jgi:hypothetical protein
MSAGTRDRRASSRRPDIGRESSLNRRRAAGSPPRSGEPAADNRETFLLHRVRVRPDAAMPAAKKTGPRVTRMRMIAALTAVLLVVVGSTIYAVTRPPAKVTLPNVVGVAATVASGQLADDHVKVVETQFFGPTKVKVGTILKEIPPPGTRVAQKSAVTLEIVDRSVDVPDVTGKYIPDGTTVLAGYVAKVKIDSVYSAEPLNMILGQTPAVRRVARGSTMTLRVSQGPKPKPSSSGLLDDIGQAGGAVFSGGKWIAGKIKGAATSPAAAEAEEEAEIAAEDG